MSFKSPNSNVIHIYAARNHNLHRRFPSSCKLYYSCKFSCKISNCTDKSNYPRKTNIHVILVRETSTYSNPPSRKDVFHHIVINQYFVLWGMGWNSTEGLRFTHLEIVKFVSHYCILMIFLPAWNSYACCKYLYDRVPKECFNWEHPSQIPACIISLFTTALT